MNKSRGLIEGEIMGWLENNGWRKEFEKVKKKIRGQKKKRERNEERKWGNEIKLTVKE